MRLGEPLTQGTPKAGYLGCVREGGSSRRRRHGHPRPALWCGALPMCGRTIAKCPIFNKCISRESNPGHIDGNDVFYH